MLLHLTDERGTTFLRKNLHDQITAQCSVLKNNRDYKNDVDNLYLQLTKLLNDKVIKRSPFRLKVLWFHLSEVFFN